MGLTSALNTSLNGLSLNETTIDVVGNNIANAGTTGFKASKVLFQTQLARTLSYGSRPTSSNGGTNPRQIGLGASVSTILPDFSQGSITATTSPSDLALQGDGFFIVNAADGPAYSRDGSFRLDAGNKLSNNSGYRLQGWKADFNNNFDLSTARAADTISDLEIPIGQLTIAQATSSVTLGGALSPQGNVATVGSKYTSPIYYDNATGVAAVATTPLIRLATSNTIGAPAVFTNNSTLELTPSKGGKVLNSKSLAVTSTTTLTDLTNLYNNTLGFQSQLTNPAYTDIPADANDGLYAGGQLEAGGTGRLIIKGNLGITNDFNIGPGTLTQTISGAKSPVSGFTFTKDAATAVGESTTTSFTIFDSLGTPLLVRLTAYLETRDQTGTTFRIQVESSDNQPPTGNDTIAIGNTTLKFDNQGRVVTTGIANAGLSNFNLYRTNTSAVSPLSFEVDLRKLSGVSNNGSSLNLTDQDGSSPGTLTSFVIDEAGQINGSFDNGIIRVLGQIALVRFSNSAGLIEAGNNAYKQGISSGEPQRVAAGSFGAATIRSGALELSNTDIGKNLVELIVASTNYRGNARVISSVDQLTNELLALGRG